MMRAVDIAGVRFRYRGAEREALAGVDFHAEPGERVAVIGLSGAGKSSLLRCVGRLVPHSWKGDFSGRVKLFGRDISGCRPAELAGEVGILFQDFEGQLFCTTAELDAAFGPENLGLPQPEIRARVDRELSRVGLLDLARRDPATLSGGQKQRLAAASILTLQPRILCLDEPTTDLDPQGRSDIAALAARLAAQDRTVIIAEHEPELVAVADRIVGLKDGRIVLNLPAPDAVHDPDILANMGVRPPDRVRALRGLGVPGRPDNWEQAAELLRDRGRAISAGQVFQWEEADRADRAREGGELIRFDALTHRYPSGLEALREADIAVRSGEMVAVLGHNGSGKTTLVKHIVGLLKPSSGAAVVQGRDTHSWRTDELGRLIGFVFQDPDHQIFLGRVEDEAAFGPRNFGFSDSDVKRRVKDALERVGLAGFEDRDPFLLTKGERQRVALASALAAGPPIIILDEPTTGLDYPAQRAVMDLLAELNRDGRTVIFITHAVWAAAEYARRVIVMDRGRIAGDGPARAVLSDLELMDRAGLAVPEITRLGLALGGPALGPDELIAALSERDR